jgi:hypothetical protein
MDGIAKIDLDLGHGGQKPLPHAKGGNGIGATLQAQAVALLMDGPKHISELSTALGGVKKARIHGAMHGLKVKKVVKGNGSGIYQLTDRARAELAPQQATLLPAPAAAPAIRTTATGRAAPGSGNIILKILLSGAAMPSSDLRAQLAQKGMSSKSISGVLDRAKRDGLVKLNGDKAYELTAKGQKIAPPNAEAVAHG